MKAKHNFPKDLKCNVLCYNTVFVDTMYTLGEKDCYTPIWGNEIDVDRIFVIPVGWN